MRDRGGSREWWTMYPTVSHCSVIVDTRRHSDYRDEVAMGLTSFKSRTGLMHTSYPCASTPG